MSDREIDELVAGVAPIDDAEVAGLDLTGPELDLCEAIMSTPVIEPLREPAAPPLAPFPLPGPPRPFPARRPRRRLALAVAAVAVAAAAAVGVVVARQPATGEGPTWGTEALRVAEVAPRLLVGADGWEVTGADSFGVAAGELNFAALDQQRSAEILWGSYDSFLHNLDAHERLADTTVAGRTAAVFEVTPGADYRAVWREDDGYGAQFRADGEEIEGFLNLAATIERVDVDTWLSALPGDVVTPDETALEAARMLEDVPVPAGFDVDVDALGLAPDLVHDRYSLGVEVIGAVACAWLGQWVTAVEAGDVAARQEAVDAMATSPEWDVLVEMYEEGYWPEVVWEYADAMAGDGRVRTGEPIAEMYEREVCGRG